MGIQLHITKANSHTGYADKQSMHNTLVEKFRILYKTNKEILIKQLIQRAMQNYNRRYHSSIKYTLDDRSRKG